MTYKEVLQAAQGQMGPCRACPVCNGRACGGTIPGPGAKGSGTVAVRNFDAWRNVRLNMDTIHENFEPDTSLTLFGRSFKYPFFAGPVGAMALHYGDKYNDLDYNNILVPACAAAGIAAFTGDGTNHKVMEGAAAAITACGGAEQRRGRARQKRACADEQRTAEIERAQPFGVQAAAQRCARHARGPSQQTRQKQPFHGPALLGQPLLDEHRGQVGRQRDDCVGHDNAPRRRAAAQAVETVQNVHTQPGGQFL